MWRFKASRFSPPKCPMLVRSRQLRMVELIYVLLLDNSLRNQSLAQFGAHVRERSSDQ